MTRDPRAEAQSRNVVSPLSLAEAERLAPPRSEGRAGRDRAERSDAWAELRRNLHQRLDAIETLVRSRPRVPKPNPSGLEQRLAELEAERKQLQEEAERYRRERQTTIEQIEHDRRLLAEAWERLEREQLRATRPTEDAGRQLPAVLLPAAATPAAATDGPEVREVLRQFLALQRDVRRNANPGGQNP